MHPCQKLEAYYKRMFMIMFIKYHNFSDFVFPLMYEQFYNSAFLFKYI